MCFNQRQIMKTHFLCTISKGNKVKIKNKRDIMRVCVGEYLLTCFCSALNQKRLFSINLFTHSYKLLSHYSTVVDISVK